MHPQALVVPVEAVVYRRPLGPDGKPVKAGADGDEEIKVVFVVDKGGQARPRSGR